MSRMHSTADMQTTSGEHEGEGLHERKPRQQTIDSQEEEEHQNGEASPDESRKDKKTFGRTPDGVGTVTFVSTLCI